MVDIRMHLKPVQQKTWRIGVLAYPGCMGTQVFGLAELLRLALDLAEARHPGAHARLDVQVLGLRGRKNGSA